MFSGGAEYSFLVLELTFEGVFEDDGVDSRVTVTSSFCEGSLLRIAKKAARAKSAINIIPNIIISLDFS